MTKLLTFLFLSTIVISCSENKDELPVARVVKIQETLLDGDGIRNSVRSSQVKLMFTDREGVQRVSGEIIHPGDVLYVKVDDMKEHVPLKKYILGLTPLSDNITITRLDKTFFQINVNKKYTESTFQMEVFLYSDEVTFDDAFHDTIDGYDKAKTGHSIAILGYAFPIEK